MNLDKLEKILEKNHQPKFRLEQIIKAVYQDGVSNFSEISNLPKNLRKILDEKLKILSFEAKKILISDDKLSVKVALKLSDGNSIETVLISPKPDLWSACISCQVGCPMGCAFCATGQGGFERNLTFEEIADQVLFWKQFLNENKNKERLASIVYMGMGEPFLNWEAVCKSLKILTSKKFFNFGSRSISVSSVGIPGGINQLASSFPQINLAISLHFPDNEKRSRFMPANASLNLQSLKKELEKYFSRCNRKVFLEYILFKNINDSAGDAKRLVKFIKGFQKSRLLHVNLIRYNETAGDFKPASCEKIQKFKEYLEESGINVTIRKSLGSQIQGACGQLAGK